MTEKGRKAVFAAWVLCAAAAAGHAEVAAFSDRQGPEIMDICFYTQEGETLKGEAAEDIGDPGNSYRYFSNGAVSVSAEISDPEPSSGLGAVIRRLLRADSEGRMEEQALEEVLGGAARETVTFTISAGFKGWLQMDAADRVGNRSAVGAEKIGLVLETEEQHSREEHLRVVRTKPEKSQEARQGNTQLELEVTDSFSGIAEVEWQVGTGRGRVEISASGGVSGDGAEEWEVTGLEANLVTGLHRSWPLDAADKVFVCVRMTDRAGNSSELTEIIDAVQETAAGGR